MAAQLDEKILSELSRHYDSTLWTVTSLWAGALGGLLVYYSEHFYLWIVLLAPMLTICPMYFGASFRRLRIRVNGKIRRRNKHLYNLHISNEKVKQWDIFLIIFLLLECCWTGLLVKHVERWMPLWVVLGIGSGAIIAILWKQGCGERNDEKNEET